MNYTSQFGKQEKQAICASVNAFEELQSGELKVGRAPDRPPSELSDLIGQLIPSAESLTKHMAELSMKLSPVLMPDRPEAQSAKEASGPQTQLGQAIKMALDNIRTAHRQIASIEERFAL